MNKRAKITIGLITLIVITVPVLAVNANLAQGSFRLTENNCTIPSDKVFEVSKGRYVSEVVSEVVSDVTSKVSSEVVSLIASEVASEVVSEVTSKVTSDVSSSVTSEISSEVTSRVPLSEKYIRECLSGSSRS